MLADQFLAAAAGARNSTALDETSRLLWRAHAEGHIAGAGAFAHRVSVGVFRRGGLRGLLVRTALAGWIRLSGLWRRPGGRAEEPGIHLRMLRLRSPDFDHGGHRDAPHKASVDGMVLGRTFDVDTFKRHVGAATGRSARPHLQDGLAGGAEAAAIDGRPRPRTSRRGG